MSRSMTVAMAVAEASNDAFDAGVEFGYRAFGMKVVSVSTASAPGVLLTRREAEVLDLVRARLQDKEIAARLGVCTRTAKFHVGSLLRKFGVRGRIDLTVRVT